MAINPNWPTMEHGWGAGYNANGGTVPADTYINVVSRVIGTTSASRGRQYETDQVQAGTAGATFANTDGAMDPMNGAGPWAGHIRPYQPYRVRAQYPPSKNLLPQVIATGGDLGGFPAGPIISGATNPIAVWSYTDTTGTGGSIVATGSAYQGSTVFQFAVSAGAAISPTYGARVCYTMQTAVIPGQQYAAQMQVRNVTTSTSVQVAAFVGWYDPTLNASGITFVKGTPVTLTGGSAPAWTQATVTATAPANAYGMVSGVVLTAVPGAACSVQVDGWQVELGAAATSFVVPGVTYPMYSGFVERWPSKWTQGGSYGTVVPTAVDAFALLSQTVLSDPVTEEMGFLGPLRFLYTLGDPQGSLRFADSTGHCPPAVPANSIYGAGSLTAGNAITATDPVNGVYTGSGGGTVIRFNNFNPGSLFLGGTTYLSLGGTSGPYGPATVGSAWFRTIAFRYTGSGLPADNSVIVSCFGPGDRSAIILRILNTGVLQLVLSGPNGVRVSLNAGSASVCDGNWHLAGFGMSTTGGFAQISLDGVDNFLSVAASNAPTGLISDNVGAYVDPMTGNGTYDNFQGDVSFYAEFAQTGVSTSSIYMAWKNGFAGDSTDARYFRILGWAGYSGAVDIPAGQTTSMGPADTSGQDALSALNDVVETEGGTHYVSASGAVTFRSRGARYNNTVPVYVFGENVSAGEWPYEDVELDYDSTHLANLVQVTQTATGQLFTGTDATSQANYFPRTMTRSINSTNALECQDAANYLVSRYRNPLSRVETLKLHPSANAALWPVCLSLELNTRVRIMRRPFGAPPIQIDAFVEHIQWDVDDQNEAFVTLQCSPVDSTPYGIVASFHTALNVPAGSGTSTLTLKVGADSTNPLAAQLGVGQQLVLEPGSANSETVTVKAVGTTSGGWTTGTVTLTAPLANSHAANAVICEPLPTGVTDPTKYDVSAKFDSAAFSY